MTKAEPAGETIIAEGIWQRDRARGFYAGKWQSIFPFFERLPWLSWRARTIGRQVGDRKVLWSWYNSTESFAGSLTKDSWREKNGEMSRGLRFEGGRIVRFGDGLAREGEWRVQLRVWTKDIIGPFQLKKPDAINLCHYTIRIGGENLQNWHSTMYTSMFTYYCLKRNVCFQKRKVKELL